MYFRDLRASTKASVWIVFAEYCFSHISGMSPYSYNSLKPSTPGITSIWFDSQNPSRIREGLRIYFFLDSRIALLYIMLWYPCIIIQCLGNPAPLLYPYCTYFLLYYTPFLYCIYHLLLYICPQQPNWCCVLVCICPACPPSTSGDMMIPLKVTKASVGVSWLGQLGSTWWTNEDGEGYRG
jgi:hypothetical protein